MTSSVSELLAALASVLEERSLRWYLFGAQAVNIWGRPRMSADVDVTIEDPGPERAALLDALKAARFEPLLGADDLHDSPVLPFVHEPTGLPLDVVIGTSGLERNFLMRAVTTPIDGVEVPVVAPEDLVVLKLLAGRPKDLDDAAGLLMAQREHLDLVAVRDLLTQLERALDQSDLLATLEDLLLLA